MHVGERVERDLRRRKPPREKVEPADGGGGGGLGPGVTQRDERHGGLPGSVDVEQRVDERIGEAQHEFRRDSRRRGDGQDVRERRAGVPEGVPVGALPVTPGVAPERARHGEHDGCGGDGRFLSGRRGERGSEVASAQSAQGVVDGGVVVHAGREVGDVGADEVQLEVVERASAASRTVVVHMAIGSGPGAIEGAIGQQTEPTEQRLARDAGRRCFGPGRGDGRERRCPDVRQLTRQLDRWKRLVNLVQQRLDVPVLLPYRLGPVGRVSDTDALIARPRVAEGVVLSRVVERYGLLDVVIGHLPSLPPHPGANRELRMPRRTPDDPSPPAGGRPSPVLVGRHHRGVPNALPSSPEHDRRSCAVQVSAIQRRARAS